MDFDFETDSIRMGSYPADRRVPTAEKALIGALRRISPRTGLDPLLLIPVIRFTYVITVTSGILHYFRRV